MHQLPWKYAKVAKLIFGDTDISDPWDDKEDHLTVMLFSLRAGGQGDPLRSSLFSSRLMPLSLVAANPKPVLPV